MKAINKIWVFALGTAVMVSCSDLDTFPESGIVTEDQKKEVVEDNPERLQADINTLSSIFTKLLPNWAGGSATPFHNDFSYPAVCIATDGNGADMVSDNSDYEWFSVAFEYSDRNANYAVPMFTWNFCYKLNKQANDILATIPADTENQTLIYYRGQALVARAFANFTLAQRFQFTYKGNEDKPTVPIVTWDMPAERAGANPRATNAEIYKLIYDDLTQAIADLEGFQRTSKAAADRNVAYGMRARVNLVMNNWGEAATDAEAALSGYTFLSKDDVSAPGFNSANSPGFVGGLLEHTLGVTKNCDYFAKMYPVLNRDLLLTAAIFHDIGKLKELSTFPENDYTDAGQLLGHIMIGAEWVGDAIKSIDGFPVVLANELKHCILAHHGELEFGSPKKPALVEALALSFADNIDAKMETFRELLVNVPENDTKWQGYNRFMETNFRRTSV